MKPLRKAEVRVKTIRGIFDHMGLQKELPIEVRRKVEKANPSYGHVSPKRGASPQKKAFFHTSAEPAMHGDDFEHAENLSPRERHVKNKAVQKIQSIFRGRKARHWVNNQDQRNFPMAAAVSAKFLQGGKRGREIFLLKKKKLLEESRNR